MAVNNETLQRYKKQSEDIIRGIDARLTQLEAEVEEKRRAREKEQARLDVFNELLGVGPVELIEPPAAQPAPGDKAAPTPADFGFRPQEGQTAWKILAYLSTHAQSEHDLKAIIAASGEDSKSRKVQNRYRTVIGPLVNEKKLIKRVRPGIYKIASPSVAAAYRPREEGLQLNRA